MGMNELDAFITIGRSFNLLVITLILLDLLLVDFFTGSGTSAAASSNFSLSIGANKP